MGTENFNRQFVLLDFRDLDNPDFMRLMRSPCFTTYLVMRRHVWRSRRPHYMGLHSYYAQGLLACSLERDKIGAALGGVTERTVSEDISQLARLGVIRKISTGRQNVYILGEWEGRDGAYYELFYLDRLFLRQEDSFTPEEQPIADRNAPPPTGRELPLTPEASRPAGAQPTSDSNREANRETNKARTGRTLCVEVKGNDEGANEAPSPAESRPRGKRASGISGLSGKQLWAAVLGELRQSLPASAFEMWLRPTTLLGIDGDTLVVGAPSSYGRDRLSALYAGEVAAAARSVSGASLAVRFEVAS